ncbi:MAG: hypothetical protein B6I30_03375 [Desulfobacteraceae bacterium 4572_187]|nr:MAG: hypothetical protein B6I30_03375 [Desulfobacteraceae bacterium 4572_187]
MMNEIFKISEDVRYVAIYRNGHLKTQSKGNTKDASSSESDKYEELLANPIMLKAASQRGNIDCGGLDYLLVRYGNFFQFILPVSWGHVSVCIEKNGDPIAIGQKVKSLFKEDIGLA